jgi:putative membrane protein
MMMWPNMMGGFFGGGLGIAGTILGFIFSALIIAGIIILIIWLIKRTGSPEVEQTNDSDALEILKQRYAKGEITKGKFDAMKKDIS